MPAMSRIGFKARDPFPKNKRIHIIGSKHIVLKLSMIT